MAARRSTGSSVTRALRVIEAVAAAGDGVTAKAVARRLDQPLPTVYRALATLVEEGYLVRLHGVRGYGLGYRVAGLHRSLTEQVRPGAGIRAALHELHGRTGAAAHLVVLRDADVVLAAVDACDRHPVPDGLAVGEPAPAHALATGKVLLAALRPARVGELLEHAGAGALTPRTIVERRELDRELLRVRSAGAAVEVDEYRTGLAGVAAPVRAPDGTVRAGLGVTVPRAEFTERRWELETAVRRAAERAGHAGRGARDEGRGTRGVDRPGGTSRVGGPPPRSPGGGG